MAEHIVPVRIYYTVFAILLALTALTVAAASFDLGELNTIVALTIAVTKAMLVILFFMHVRYATGLTWLVLTAGFAWLALLILFTLSDVFTRGWLG